LYDYLENHFDVGLVAPKLLYANKKAQQSYFAYYHLMTPLYRRTFLGKTKAGQKDLDRFTMKDIDVDKATAVDWLMGSFWMIRKEVFNDLEGFDERYFMYFEDSDLCRRVNEAGHKVVYYSEAEAIHLHARDSKSTNFWSSIFNKMTWVHLTSAYKYFRKFGIKSKK
jgi:GT2 family glycosyltransferase